MAGLNDLVLQAQPALLDRSLASATEGRSWRWEITGFVDTLGAAVDFTSATCTCIIQDKVDGATILTLTAVGSLGQVTITAGPSATANLANGKPERDCVWSLALTFPSAGGTSLQVWGPVGSRFKIKAS